MFKIVEVDERNKNYVIKRLRLNVLRNLFVIYDLIYEPDKLVTYVAYENDNLSGLLLLYKSTPPMVRIDGEEHIVCRLLEYLPNDNMILYCPPSLVNMVKNKFPQANCYLEYQMYVGKGEQNFITPNLATKLESKHTQLLAELYSSALQGEPRLSKERIKELLETGCRFFGVFDEERLVSVAGSIKRLPEVGEITGVFTHPKYRGKGFATMATSSATEHILRYSNGSTLYVGAYNKPAIRVYEKLGYRKIDEWYWVDIGTGIRP
jgi:ribosomal protein S18 acetylase RimI-like enzyme